MEMGQGESARPGGAYAGVPLQAPAGSHQDTTAAGADDMLDFKRSIQIALACSLLTSCFTILGTALTLSSRDDVEEVRRTDEGGLVVTVGARRPLLDPPATLFVGAEELEDAFAQGEPWPRIVVSAEQARARAAGTGSLDSSATHPVSLQRRPACEWERPPPEGWSVVYEAGGDGENVRFELLVRRAAPGEPPRGVVLVITDEPSTTWDSLSGLLAFVAVDGVILLIAAL